MHAYITGAVKWKGMKWAEYLVQMEKIKSELEILVKKWRVLGIIGVGIVLK